MRFIPLLCLVLLTGSCTQANIPKVEEPQATLPDSQANLHRALEVVSIEQFSSDCTIENEVFNDSSPLWSISDLLEVQSIIKQDLTQDGVEESIALLRPTEKSQEVCELPIFGEVMIVITNPETNETVMQNLNIGYASVPTLFNNQLYNDNNGFYLDYEIGQSIKCSNRIGFTLEQSELVINTLKSICYVPIADESEGIGWQERSFENELVKPEDIDFLGVLDELQVAFFK